MVMGHITAGAGGIWRGAEAFYEEGDSDYERWMGGSETLANLPPNVRKCILHLLLASLRDAEGYSVPREFACGVRNYTVACTGHKHVRIWNLA